MSMLLENPDIFHLNFHLGNIKMVHHLAGREIAIPNGHFQRVLLDTLGFQRFIDYALFNYMPFYFKNLD